MGHSEPGPGQALIQVDRGSTRILAKKGLKMGSKTGLPRAGILGPGAGPRARAGLAWAGLAQVINCLARKAYVELAPLAMWLAFNIYI